jgi:hypothetical protein
MGIFWAFKSESILPIQILEIDEEMPLFDLHTVGFWGMKNAGKMADSERSQEGNFAPFRGRQEDSLFCS